MLKKKASEVVAAKLTEELTKSLGQALGVPTKDGLSVSYDPRENRVWVGYRRSF